MHWIAVEELNNKLNKRNFMKIKKLPSSLSLIIATFFTLPVYADISIEYKNGDTRKITGNYYKVSQEQDALISIVNLKGRTITLPSDRFKSYVKMSVQDMCGSNSVAQEALTDMKSSAGKGEQHEQMAALLAQMQVKEENKVKIINLGVSDIIAGYKTTKYQISVNDEVKEMIWQTTDEDVFNEIEHLTALLDEFSCNDNDYQDSKPYKALAKKGFPLKTFLNDAAIDESNNSFGSNHYNDEDTEEVFAINFDKISNDEFIVPIDYKKTTMAEQMQRMYSSKH